MELDISEIHDCCRICLKSTQDEEVFELDEQIQFQFKEISQVKVNI